MPKFNVTVKVTHLEYWEVEADNAEEAEENYGDGECTGTGDSNIDSEVVGVEEQEVA